MRSNNFSLLNLDDRYAMLRDKSTPRIFVEQRVELSKENSVRRIFRICNIEGIDRDPSLMSQMIRRESKVKARNKDSTHEEDEDDRETSTD